MPKQNIKVEVKDPVGIYNLLIADKISMSNEPGTHELSYTTLNKPIQNMGVIASSNGEHFSITAEIHGEKEMLEINDLYERMKDKFTLKIIGEGMFVINDEGDDEIIVHISDNPNHDSYEGTVFVELGGSSIRNPVSIGSVDIFTEKLSTFATIVQITINQIYISKDIDCPEHSFAIKPDLSGSSQNKGASSSASTSQSSLLVIENPKVPFTDIAGEFEAKDEIEILVDSLNQPESYRKWGTTPTNSILLTGEPGTGKTLLAKALATEAGLPFLSINVVDVASMWYGEPERMAQAAFDKAYELAPSVLFFDELDAIASIRDLSHEATQRIIAVMLVNLDGMKSKPGVIFLAATNRPDSIDPAIKRSGRIQKIIEVPLPDFDTMFAVAQHYVKKAEELAQRKLFKDINWKHVLSVPHNFSCADVEELIRRVLEKKAREECKGKTPKRVISGDFYDPILNISRGKTETKQIGYH